MTRTRIVVVVAALALSLAAAVPVAAHDNHDVVKGSTQLEHTDKVLGGGNPPCYAHYQWGVWTWIGHGWGGSHVWRHPRGYSLVVTACH